MIAIVFLMLIAKILMDLYLNRLNIRDLSVFCLVQAFLCVCFYVTKNTSMKNFAIVSGLVDVAIEDFKTREIYQIQCVLFLVIGAIACAVTEFNVLNFVVMLVLVGLCILTGQRYVGLCDLLIVMGILISMSKADTFNFIFYLGIISGIRALMFIMRKEANEEIAFVPVIWSSFLLYVVMGNVFNL